MAKRAGNTKKVALGGTLSALSLTLMLVGSILPFSEYITVVLAGLVLVIVSGELGLRYAFTVYCVVALLSSILLPSKELAMLFVMLFGYYPLIKYRLDSLGRLGGAIAKLALFNISMTITYLVLLYLFTTSKLLESFEDSNLYLDSLGRLGGAIAKLALFNISMTITYLVLLYLFTTSKLLESFEDSNLYFIILLYVLGNIFFIVYDKFVAVAWRTYFTQIAPIIKRIF